MSIFQTHRKKITAKEFWSFFLSLLPTTETIPFRKLYKKIGLTNIEKHLKMFPFQENSNWENATISFWFFFYSFSCCDVWCEKIWIVALIVLSLSCFMESVTYRAHWIYLNIISSAIGKNATKPPLHAVKEFCLCRYLDTLFFELLFFFCFSLFLIFFFFFASNNNNHFFFISRII